MITEIISNSFTADKRTSMQRVTFDKSDDLFMLASKQRRYEDIRATILNPPEGYSAIPKVIQKESHRIMQM